MALIICKECNAEYSNQAKRCIHCGAKTPSKHSMFYLSYFLVIGVLLLFSNGFFKEEKNMVNTNLPAEDKSISTPTNVDRYEPSYLLNQETNAVKDPIILPKWKYSEFTDDMRGDANKVAYLTSENTVYLNRPYDGGSTLELNVRKKNKKLDGIWFQVSSGQITCHVYNCAGSVRFDKNNKKGKVENLQLAEAESHSSDVVFVANETKFFKKLKESDFMVIELLFFDYGKAQFEFDTKELNF